MRWSFHLFTIRGIPVRIHYIFPLLLFFLVVAQSVEQDTRAGLLLLGRLLILFLLILIHELSHSFMARRYGIKVVDIILWPLGGIARLAGIIQDPKVELMVAIAGPAVNILLGLLTLPFFLSGYYFLGWFCLLNFLIGLFNLFPAFPMDGGRILRALLAFRTPFLRATAIAVKVGAILALFLALAAIIFSFLPATKDMGFPVSLLLIALFIYITGREEEKRVRLEYYREHFDSGGREFIFPEGKVPKGYGRQKLNAFTLARALFHILWRMGKGGGGPKP